MYRYIVSIHHYNIFVVYIVIKLSNKQKKMFVVITATVVVAIIMYYLLQHVEYNFKFESTVEADFEAIYSFWNDLSNLEKVHPYV